MRSSARGLVLPAYPVLLALGAVDAAGYSVIAPVLPALARATGAGPAAAGALVATFPLGILLGFPLAGAVVRRRGTPLLLVGSLLVLAAGALGFLVADRLRAYALARAVMGVGSGGLWIAITFSTLEHWPGQEYLCMSRILSTYSIGGLLGPAIGAMGGIRPPFVAYLTIVLLAVPLVVLKAAPAGVRRFDADRTTLRLPAFRSASSGIGFAVLALALADGVFPLHLSSRLTQTEIGAAYVWMALAVAVAAAAAARIDPRRATSSGSLLAMGGLTLVGASSDPGPWLIGLLLTGIGVGLVETGSVGVLLRAVPAERIVTAMVVWSELGILGYLIGPPLGGAVAEWAGFGAVSLVAVPAAVTVLALTITADRSD